MASPGAAGSLAANKQFVIDGVAPTISSLSSTNSNDRYGIGDVIAITAQFTEAVTVVTTGGFPTITLETNTAVDGSGVYVSGSGTNTLTFNYTVVEGETSGVPSNEALDAVSTNSLTLNGGTIKDAAGNNATLTLPIPQQTNSLSANKDIIIDGIRPTLPLVIAQHIIQEWRKCSY